MYLENKTYQSWIDSFQRFLWPLSDEIVKRSRAVLAVHRKNDDSPVTDLDRWSQSQIVSFLMQLTPEITVIAEEDNLHKAEQYARRFWLVDPIDGTREMIRGSDEFTVNIALVDGGMVQFSWMVAPLRSIMWYALRNAGAWTMARHNEKTLLQPEDYFQHGFPRAPRVLVSRSLMSERLSMTLKRDLPGIDVVKVGSALKLAMLAMDQADILIHPRNTFEWDTAAGHLLIEEMGGQVYNLDLTPLSYGKSDYKNDGYLAFKDNHWIEYFHQHHFEEIIKNCRERGS